MTPEERLDCIARIRALPQQVAALLDGLSADQLTARPLPGEWSIAQNVHHLADSHLNSYIRLKLILAEEQPTLKPYDQEVWAEMPDATPADVSASLELLRGLHTRWTGLFEVLTADQWTRTGLHPEVGVITPEDLVRTYAEHGAAHLDQIQRTRAALG